jgi:dipeptidase E
MRQNNLLLISSSYVEDGDYLEHCWEVLENFYKAANGGHILFIPYANAYDWPGFAQECMPYFEKHDIKVKSILDYDVPRSALDDQNLAGIFMAGGNTFKLIKYLYEYELIEPLRQRVEEGLPYAGTSAGAVVACPGIYTTNDMPMVEPEAFDALNFVPFQINPHFVGGELIPDYHGETREQRIRQFHTGYKMPVVGLKEGGWLEVHEGSLELGGKDVAVLFEAGKDSETLAPGIVAKPMLSKSTDSSS